MIWVQKLKIGFLVGTTLFLSIGVPGQSFSQQKNSTQPTNSSNTEFLSSRPDILVVVTQHPLGPDLFTISALDSNYPPAALNTAIAALGKGLNSAPRGLNLTVSTVKTSSGDAQNFLQATFAMDGFMKPDAVKLQELTRAFTGLPAGAGQVNVLDISLAGFAASSHTIQRYEGPNPQKPAVAIVAQSYKNPAGVEYRVKILNQDPSQIIIPDSTEQLVNLTPPKGKNSNGVLIIELVVIGLAGIGGGLFVYNFLLRGGSRAKSRPRSVIK